MTRATVTTLPKCAAGLCAWRSCHHTGTSMWLTWRIRLQPTRIRFCNAHRTLVMGGALGYDQSAATSRAVQCQEAA